MKILWFVNIPLKAYLTSRGQKARNIGGWLDSLLSAVRLYEPSLDMAIAFEGESNCDVIIDGVSYYSMKRGRVYKEVERVIREFKPDIIHIHGSDGIGLKIPDFALKGTKTVLSIQGIINGYAQHYMGGLTAKELTRHRNIVRAMLGYRTTLDEAEYWRTTRSNLERRLLNSVCACLGRTDWDRAWVAYLAPSTRYFHVGEIMREPFYRGVRNQNEVVPHSIYCSASLAYPLKGGHWLLRAVASLKHKYPDISLSVANAARVTERINFRHSVGKNEYYRYLTALIQELDLKDNLRMLPSLGAEQVRDELSKAELFCLPSIIENSPNSLSEAMLVGVPTIATDVGGTASMLRNGKDGKLVPSGDPAALASAIDEFFQNTEQASTYARSAYEVATIRHNPRDVVSDLLVAYNATLKG